MKIYTITLNPAYDIHAYTESFKPFCEQLAKVISRDAGGKGVNISRALVNAGVKNTAIVVLGRENGEEFRQALSSVCADCLYFERDGRIRENLTLHSDGGKETRISFAGFSADEALLEEISSAVLADANTVITFTGRVPDGISVNSVIRFLQNFKSKGARIVLDSKSFSFEDICALRPWLIKPNEEEISHYLGCEVKTINAAVDGAKLFYDNGVDNVMVSLGAQGALLLCGEGCFIAKTPNINAVSTIGAGDSSIGGFIAAANQSLSPAECLCTAVAFGTAACLNEGSLPPEKQNIDRIRKQIIITKL